MEKIVFMKCRRPDKILGACTGMQAEKLNVQIDKVTFKCSKCGYVWTVATGGPINI